MHIEIVSKTPTLSESLAKRTGKIKMRKLRLRQHGSKCKSAAVAELDGWLSKAE